MRALQPGLPSPVAIPEGHNVIIIDLQDCFFTIPLNTEDKKRFAFSLPSENLKQPYLRFLWKVLPQGMKNSPTLCQKFVNAALDPLERHQRHTWHPRKCSLRLMPILLHHPPPEIKKETNSTLRS